MIIITLLPVLLLVLLLAVTRIKMCIAAVSALVSASLISMFFYSNPPHLIFFSILEGSSIALWPILFVITSSIFAYNYTCRTGAMEGIKKLLLSVSPDKSVQTLILAWGFGSFMEGIAGYGTAVAIPAGIMASIGFNPFAAAVLCLTANTVSTAFGAVGIPAVTLSLMTSLDLQTLTAVIAIQLLPVTFLLPFVLVVMTEKSAVKALKYLPETAAASLSFAVVFMLSAFYLGPQFPTILGSIASILSVTAVTRYAERLRNRNSKIEDKNDGDAGRVRDNQSTRDIVKSLSVYIFILVFILLSSPVFPAVRQFLDSFSSTFVMYPGAEGKAISFYWLSTPGILIAAAVFANALVFRVSLSLVFSVLFSTVRQLTDAALAITALVSAAAVMRYSGMIDYLAFYAAAAAGSMFPLFSPLIGALGTFLTGSDTSSCILFGAVQKNIGIELGIDKFWLPAANMSGATAGKMIAPQSIAVAAAAVGLKGKEGLLLRSVAAGCAVYALLLGIIIYSLAGYAGVIADFSAGFVK